MDDDKKFDELQKSDKKHFESTKEIREERLNYRAAYRIENLLLIFELYIAPNVKAQDPNVIVRLNEDILNTVVYSYFHDVDRFKHFHGADLINTPKKMAYMIKWIVKHRPIYYDDKSTDNDNLRGFLSIINEFYALCVAFSYAKISPSEVPAELKNRLIYDFLFRVHDEHALVLCFETLYLLTGRDMSDTILD